MGESGSRGVTEEAAGLVQARCDGGLDGAGGHVAGERCEGLSELQKDVQGMGDVGEVEGKPPRQGSRPLCPGPGAPECSIFMEGQQDSSPSVSPSGIPKSFVFM